MISRGELLKGHIVSATGSIDKATGTLIADLILIGAKPPGR